MAANFGPKIVHNTKPATIPVFIVAQTYQNKSYLETHARFYHKKRC